MNEPIADAVRGILDGHIVLNRAIANKGHFPAIDVLASISRVMKDIAPEEQIDAVNNMKRLMAVYKESEDLINIGAYQRGSNAAIDEAMDQIDHIWNFTKQKVDEKVTLSEVQERLILEFARR
jgi:flagellum-specific ATP synthase